VTLEHNEQHEEQLADLPIEVVVKGFPRKLGFLEAVSDQLQALEDVFIDLRDKFSIDEAEGDMQDVIGRIVGEPRRGSDDDVYRNRQRVRVLVNRSNGRIPEILKILRLFEGWTGTGNASLRDIGTMALELILFTPIANPISELRVLLAAVKGAGVRLDVVYTDEPEAETALFGWSGDYVEDEARGLGWSGDLDIGGKAVYAEVIS
jgi:hypothetical protein